VACTLSRRFTPSWGDPRTVKFPAMFNVTAEALASRHFTLRQAEFGMTEAVPENQRRVPVSVSHP